MSINSFKTKSSVSVDVMVNCYGSFNPFAGFGNMQWSLTGNVSGSSGTIPGVREITCERYPQTQNVSFYEINGSTGFTSGTIPIGIQPEIFFGDNKGFWKVNTDPVLQPNGKINGQDASRLIYYIVGLPENTTEDDPILISPQIDNLFRVYPGDFVCIDRIFGAQRWTVYPKFRLPKTDRTFLWTPNTSPVLASGGIAGGVLAKPGTIMIPDKDFWIIDPANAIDGMRYFYKGIGILFNGQKWSQLTGTPFVLNPESDSPAIWNRYVTFNSPNYYERRLEFEHTYKFNLNTIFDLSTNSDLQFTITPESGTPVSYPVVVLQGLTTPVFVNHGDAYSAHEVKTRQFAKTNNLNWYGSGVIVAVYFDENPSIIELLISFFESGNNTEYQTEGIGDEGQTLTNFFTTSTSITVS